MEIKIAVHIPSQCAYSIRNYIDNVLKRLVTCVEFYRFESIKQSEELNEVVDIFWFPYCTGGSSPYLRFLRILNKKIVITLHGAAPFSLLPKVYYPSFKTALRCELIKYISFIKWQNYKKITNKIITVSKFAKKELSAKLKIPPDKIQPIYHGVDTSLFKPANQRVLKDKKYLLHISQYQPKKNVDRIVKAYKKLHNPKPNLVLIVPGYKKNIRDKNIILIKNPKQSEELVKFYQEAAFFIFPSLHETFGMPILEAMACGCPVITSNITGCAEIAGNAALLVGPYSVEQIAEAMQRLIEDFQLRRKLYERGMEKIKQFTWDNSAAEHLKIFKEVMNL